MLGASQVLIFRRI